MSGKGLRIGLTGSIGTGKSRVAELFKAHGARVIDADQIGRLILEPGKKGWQALQAAFGERFFNSDQTVDRQKLRSAIFTDRTLRTELDKLLHPLIRQEIELACQEEAELTVVEIPLLYETGWQEDFDLVVVVAADDQRCLSRIMARDGVSRPEAKQALAAQMGIKEKVALADHVIDNNGAWSDTVSQVDGLINKLTVG
jgi:dephospho-CoA kinase